VLSAMIEWSTQVEKIMNEVTPEDARLSLVISVAFVCAEDLGENFLA